MWNLNTCDIGLVSEADSQHWLILWCLCFSTTGARCQSLAPRNTLKLLDTIGALFLNCSVQEHASIRWKRFVNDSHEVTIALNHDVRKNFRGDFRIEGLYSLIFLNPALDQAGQYGCQDTASGVDSNRADVVMLGEYRLQS